MLATYGNLAALRRRNNVANSDTTGDARYLDKLRVATRGVTEYCHRDFLPRIATRRFDYESDYSLFLNYHDLLELSSLTSGGVALSVASDDVILLNWAGDNVGPYYGIELVDQNFSYVSSKTRATTVVGTWGWHDDYTNAFVNTNVTCTASDALTETLTTSADPTSASDGDGVTPVLSPGDLVKCESEFMVVKTVTALGFTATRGVRGSTAAGHSTKSLTRWKVPADVIEATLTWASYLLVRDDFDDSSIKTDPSGNKVIPPGFPSRICDLLDPLVNVRVS